jgi:hypothetical protein
VYDAVTKLEAHRNTRVPELVKQRLVHGKLQISARLNRNADRHTSLVSADNGISKPR